MGWGTLALPRVLSYTTSHTKSVVLIKPLGIALALALKVLEVLGVLVLELIAVIHIILG